MTEVVNDQVWRIVPECLRSLVTLWSYHLVLLLVFRYIVALTVGWLLLARQSDWSEIRIWKCGFKIAVICIFILHIE